MSDQRAGIHPIATVAVDRCVHGNYTLSLNLGHSSERVLGTPHCRWTSHVLEWPVTVTSLRDLISQLECLVNDIQNAERQK